MKKLIGFCFFIFCIIICTDTLTAQIDSLKNKKIDFAIYGKGEIMPKYKNIHPVGQKPYRNIGIMGLINYKLSNNLAFATGLGFYRCDYNEAFMDMFISTRYPPFITEISAPLLISYSIVPSKLTISSGVSIDYTYYRHLRPYFSIPFTATTRIKQIKNCSIELGAGTRYSTHWNSIGISIFSGIKF